jgi:hypothetical protein
VIGMAEQLEAGDTAGWQPSTINAWAGHASIAGNRACVLGSLLLFFLCRSVFGAEEAIPPLRPPRPALPPSFWAEHAWVVAVAAIVLLAGVAVWLNWLRRPKPVIITPPEVLARSAFESLRSRPEDVTLIAEVSHIFRHYVIAVFGLPPEEMTTTELQKALQSHPRAEPDLVSAMVSFLRRCDEWKFAPAPLVPESGVVATALELWEKIEAQRKAAPKVLQPQS